MDIKEFVCASAYEFLKAHYTEIDYTPDKLGDFKTWEDIFEAVKTNPTDAVWCLTEVFNWGCFANYTVNKFMVDDEKDIYGISYNGKTRYIQMIYSPDYEIYDFREVKKVIKLVEAIDWKPIDAIEEEELNLIAILKDCPIGTKLYSTLHGEVKYCGLSEEGDNKFPINCIYAVGVDNLDSATCCFNEKGKSIESFYYGECVLFPSREQKDWTKFKINN